MGNEPIVWGPEWPMPAGLFELGILANLKDTARAAEVCGRVVRVSHGIIDDEMGEPGWHFTSEEVRDKWGGVGPIVRQPIDLKFWTPGDENRGLLVRHSYRSGFDYLEATARNMGLGYRHLRTETPETVRAALQRAAVVVATGRAAVEAMACGAPVVIADCRSYQGPLLDPDTLGSMARNYSGRGGFVPAPSSLRRAVQLAADGESLRFHVEQHHDARRIAEDLLCYNS